MHDRLKLMSFFFLGGIVALTARLFYWQVLRGGDYTKLAQAQQRTTGKLIAHRGNILSSDGTYLAATREAWQLFGDIPNLTDAHLVSEKLAPYLVDDSQNEASVSAERLHLYDLLTQKDTQWVALMNKVSNSTKDLIDKENLSGIGFDPTEARSYPEGSSSAHLLGFVGKDSDGRDTGYFGLEGYYDLLLSGKPGFEQKEANALGVPLVSGEQKEKLPDHGIDLVTSIDKTVQLTIEKYLSFGLSTYEAKAGTIIVMNPKNGEILGMASSPSFDPANYWDYTNSDFLNPSISYSFEPGSIMKPLVMAAGFDRGVITPESICDICTGPYKVDKYFIETWDNNYHPNSSMKDIIIHSDNVGMVYIGNKIGKEALFDYFDSFGFGKTTGIDLQGEMTPALRAKESWNIVDLATASFGQGIAVTPIQMITAFSTLANKGKTVVPHLVKEMKSGDWDRQLSFPEGKQVLSPESVDQMRSILEDAVKFGEAKWAAPKGFRIAGKTGTAQIPVSGHYDATKTNASFIAYAPADNPKFIMLVILQEPQSSPWAAETSAPLWFTIAKTLFPYFGIRPVGS